MNPEYNIPEEGDKFIMENEQRINLDVAEKSDESVCVRIRTEAENNDDTAVELELDSTAVVQGSGCGRGRGPRGNTTPITSRKRGAGGCKGSSSGRIVYDAWNHLKKSSWVRKFRRFAIIVG